MVAVAWWEVFVYERFNRRAFNGKFLVCLIAGRLREVVAHGSSTVLYFHCKFFRESCSSDNVKLIVEWFFFFLSFIFFWRLMKTCGAPSKSNSISKEKSRAKFEGNSKRLLPVACCGWALFCLCYAVKFISRRLYFHWNTPCITLQWFYGAL